PCRDYMIALLPLMIMSIYLYGRRPLIMFARTLALTFLCDLLVAGLRGRRYDASDISSYVFAFIYVLMLPASVQYTVVLAGVAFTVLIGKHAFGGYEHYPFHPSAFGFAFAAVSFPEQVFRYPKPFSDIGLGWESGATLYSGVANSLKYGGVPNIDTSDLFIGNYEGPMGTTFCLIILACMVLFIAHRTISAQITLSYLVTCAAWSALFPRIQTGPLTSVLYELFSGAVIFCAVFMVPEPSTSPRTNSAKLLYGFTLAVTTMIFRAYGVFEMGVCFSLLLISPLSPAFDRLVAAVQRKRRHARKGGAQ
ncbi:MAG: RnfABCDGE type electron transport complex subunit D, partial [Oscillospiraceae bacterium]|nr:RnfABCDGE type electron transport complex subunit D [Oscillospiraceae bacterium]